jgi:flavin-dependent dehydrogenase
MALRPRPFQKCYGGGGVFLAGEAAGFINPNSLEGISYAMESGRRLSGVFLREAAIQPEKALASYKKACHPLCAKLFLKNLKTPFMYNGILRSLVMKSGITSIKSEKALY